MLSEIGGYDSDYCCMDGNCADCHVQDQLSGTCVSIVEEALVGPRPTNLESMESRNHSKGSDKPSITKEATECPRAIRKLRLQNCKDQLGELTETVPHVKQRSEQASQFAVRATQTRPQEKGLGNATHNEVDRSFKSAHDKQNKDGVRAECLNSRGMGSNRTWMNTKRQ